MQLAIISLRQSLYSTQRLFEAAAQLGVPASHFNPLQTQLTLATQSTTTPRSATAETARVVIPRIAASVNYLGCALLRQLQAEGYRSLNPPQAIETANDQLRTLQRLQAQQLSIPRTAFGCQPEHLKQLLETAGGLPVVAKQVASTHGQGVALIRSYHQAEQLIGEQLAQRQNLLVQQYIAEADGKDLRCIVIGDQVVAAMQRQASNGEFRANLHLGGSASQVQLTQQEQQLAIAAAQALGLAVAGVDLIRSAHGPLILEVNASPGLEGIEQITGKDIAMEIVRYALQSPPQGSINEPIKSV